MVPRNMNIHEVKGQQLMLNVALRQLKGKTTKTKTCGAYLLNQKNVLMIKLGETAKKKKKFQKQWTAKEKQENNTVSAESAFSQLLVLA